MNLEKIEDFKSLFKEPVVCLYTTDQLKLPPAYNISH